MEPRSSAPQLKQCRVTVVVVTHDAADVLARCLTSIRASTGGEELLVVVVDNGSRDGTTDLLRAQDGVVLVQQGNTGYAHAVNRGIERAPAEHHVLVLNPDVVVERSTIARLAELMEGEPTVGIAVPAICDPSGRRAPSLRRDPAAWRTMVEAVVGGDRAGRFGERFAPAGEQCQQADWATGAAMLIRREALDLVGSMSEDYFLYSEETDYCQRVRDAGYRLVCDPLATVVHVGGDMHSNPALWTLRAVNRIRLHRKRHGRLRAAGMWIASLFFELRRAFTGETVSRSAARVLLTCRNLDDTAVSLVVALGGDPAPMVAHKHRA